MAVSNQEINTWLQANAGATDPQIAAAMNQYGVSTGQMAQATGLDQGAVQSRYNAAIAPNQANPQLSVDGLFQQYAGKPADQGQLDYWGQQFGSVVDPGEVALFGKTYNPAVQEFIQSQTGRAPTLQEMEYWGKQFGSEIDPGEVSLFGRTYNPAIQDFVRKETGNAPTLMDLESLGKQFGSEIDAGEVDEIKKFFGAKAKSAADLNKQFGMADGVAAPTTEGILSGFKYAKDTGLREEDLKNTLGEDVFNTYKTGFTDYAKTGIANILADKKLSFDEAREAVKFGRDYGYDSQKLADLTGQKKELFDTINKSYDDTTNKLVDSVLGAEDVKTDGDKIGRALALQQKYGFTDEDLAKATDLSLDQVKDYLNPVRNFESDYKKLLEDPNRNEDKTREFLTASMKNPLLKEKFGDKFQPVLDEMNRPPRERMLDQVEAQKKALGGNYYSGVFGDTNNILNVLERKGVKSLADLGQKEKFQTATAEAQYVLPNGRAATRLEDGTYGFYDDTGYDNRFVQVNPDEMQKVYGRYATDGNGETTFTPLKEEELATLKDGKFQERLGNVVINKRTGEEITDSSRQLAFQHSSGGLKKKKNWLTVEFDKSGNPVLVASTAKAGLGAALQDAMPMIAMALPFVLPGLGAGLSAMLPGAAVAATGAAAAIPATLMNTALTQGIIGGGLSTLSGGQFEKGFLGGAISPVISSGIGSLLPAGLDANATRAITGAGTGVVKGALQGGNFEDLLQQGVLSGLTNYGLGEATKGLNLTPQQLNFATGIAAPLLQGQKVSPIKALSTLAQAGQQAQKARP